SFLQADPGGHFLVIGGGPAEADVKAALEQAGVADRLHTPGPLQGQDLADAYHAMDLFAFASKTETQGMVLAEAMTARLPVVALDAPGARDVVADGECGRLLREEVEAAFTATLRQLADHPERLRAMGEAARRTAAYFSLERCADRVLEL